MSNNNNNETYIVNMLSELFALLNNKYDTKTNTNRRIHSYTLCDFCKKDQIEGDRYCCTVCDDYDLCSKCFCSGRFNKSHQPFHPCLCIPHEIPKEEKEKFIRESRLPVLAKKYANNENGAVCDLTPSNKHKLRGIRIKCDSCYNYDLCYECWCRREHNTSHPMLVFFSEILVSIPFGEIHILERLGGGAFGDVYKAYLKTEQNKVACKLVGNQSNEGRESAVQRMSLQESVESILNEMRAHREIRSAFLCKLFGYSVGSNRICLILEFMQNGSLLDIIEKENEGVIQVPLLRKVKIMSDIANGLYDIHKKNYIHADIKSDNILIDGDFNAKISDLGIIKNKNDQTNNGIGNTFYLPYEFYTGKYGKNVDVFSFGLVAYHLFTKETHKWTHARPCESRELILSSSSKIRLNVIDAVVDLCVIKDPNERMEILVFKLMLTQFYKSACHMLEDTRYYELTAEQKDRVVLRFSDEIFAATLSEIVLESKLCEAGLSYNDLKNPETQKYLNTLSVAISGSFMNSIKNKKTQNDSTACCIQ